MQHDPVNIAQAQALHPNWRQDDTILARLAQNAAEVPGQIAMRERDRGIWQEYTWADYLRAVVEFAAGLEARGVKPGDVVSLGDKAKEMALVIEAQSLPERERQVIALRFARDMTQQQVSRIIGVSQVQVSRIEKRALAALREKLCDT